MNSTFDHRNKQDGEQSEHSSFSIPRKTVTALRKSRKSSLQLPQPQGTTVSNSKSALEEGESYALRTSKNLTPKTSAI